MERQLRFDEINTTLLLAMSAAALPLADHRTRQHMDTSPIGLPNEIIEEILSKVDVKSLVRFKSISKSWQSVISRILESKLSEHQNKFFIGTMPVTGPLYLTRLEKDRKFRTEPVSGYPSGEPLAFPVCSCNGLVLLYNRYEDSVMLWNPFIGKHITIPTFNAENFAQHHHSYNGPTTNYQHHHLYHDSTTDDHRIVFVRGACYAVYSCNNGDWRQRKDFPYELLQLNRIDMAAFVDGCFYGVRFDDDEITCFDDRDGKTNMLKVPDEVRGYQFHKLVLKAVSGHLCLYFCDEDRKLLHLWVMEENRSFDKRWRNVMGMEKVNPNVLELIPVCLSNEDDVVLWGIVLEEKRSVTKHFLYNPRENSSFRVRLEVSRFVFPIFSESLHAIFKYARLDC